MTEKEILLVELPPWDPRTPPLGIAYLVSFLKSKGIGAKVFDLNIEMYNNADDAKKKGWGNEDYHWWRSNRLEEKYLLLFESFADRILSFDTKIIGFSAVLPSIPFLNYLLKSLKKKAPDKIIIVGGPAVFFYKSGREDFDRSLIDYFVIGDGETALYELVTGNTPSCKTWKDNPLDKAICAQTATIMDLDSVGYPTFEEFSLPAYTEGDFTLPIIFSKGCNKTCIFCSDTVLSYPYRRRIPEKVINEIKMHIARYPDIYTFRLNDLSFNADLRFLEKFCDRVIAERLQIKWYGQAQVRPDMDEDMFLKMKSAGCRQFFLGVENFSDNVLSIMKKRYTSEQAVRFIQKSKKAGIEVHIAIIVGCPGETEEDFGITLGCIKENAAYIDRLASLNICGLPVGSELWKNPEKYQYHWFSNGDWETYDKKNTLAVRKKRYNDVIKCCGELGIPVDCCLDLDVYEAQFRDKINI